MILVGTFQQNKLWRRIGFITACVGDACISHLLSDAGQLAAWSARGSVIMPPVDIAYTPVARPSDRRTGRSTLPAFQAKLGRCHLRCFLLDYRVYLMSDMTGKWLLFGCKSHESPSGSAIESHHCVRSFEGPSVKIIVVNRPRFGCYPLGSMIQLECAC